jgi:hypothetical protein
MRKVVFNDGSYDGDEFYFHKFLAEADCTVAVIEHYRTGRIMAVPAQTLKFVKPYQNNLSQENTMDYEEA